MGYSLQGNRKVQEGGDHPDRDAQFNFINNKVKKLQAEQQPVISVDAKKKENIGNFKNAGHEYCKQGKPTEVKVYDFIDVIRQSYWAS
jgi:translation initiation factor 2 gamma subunit (eIF-2gamma)